MDYKLLIAVLVIVAGSAGLAFAGVTNHECGPDGSGCDGNNNTTGLCPPPCVFCTPAAQQQCFPKQDFECNYTTPSPSCPSNIQTADCNDGFCGDYSSTSTPCGVFTTCSTSPM